MQSEKSRVILVLVAAAVVATLAIPAAAVAVPGMGRGVGRASASNATSGTPAANREQRLAELRARIVAVLERRKARFDSVTARVTANIERASSVADKVEAAGGDVSGVRSSLDAAKQHLQQALDLEQQAVDAFKAVPNAPNKFAAFMSARGIGREAGGELMQARASLKESVTELRTIVHQVRSESATSTPGAGNAQ